MSKISLLTASVLGVVGVAASSIAFADTNMESTYCKPGFYVGLQAGQSNTGYDSNDLLPQARTDHVSENSESANPVFTNQEVDKLGIGGRLFAGYQFNPYFAMETGYTQFNKTDFSAISKSSPSASTYDRYDGELTQHAIDIVAKGTLPLPNGFGAYVDAGAAYIASDRHINEYGPLPGSSSNPPGIGTIYTASYQGVRPTYGAGLDYTIPSTPVDVQVFYQGIAGHGAFATTHLWGLGASYKFA